MSNFINYKACLNEFAQKSGAGSFSGMFDLSTNRLTETTYQCVLTQKDSEIKVTGNISVGKKNTERDACKRMYSLIYPM